MKRLLPILVLLILSAGLSRAQDPLNPVFKPSMDTTCTDYPSNVWVSGPLEKIYQTTGTAPTCPGTDANKWITVNGTQNEIVDFQVHIHDTGSGTTGYQVTVSSFVQTSPGSFTIAAPDSTHRDTVIYLERYVNVGTGSATQKAGIPTALNIMQTPGTIPDILVPAIDPYYHQTTNAMPMNIAASQNQSVWVDVHIPSNAPSGYYKGTVTLSRGCTGTYPGTGCTTIAALPIIIGVWQWPSAGFMPSTTSFRSYHANPDNSTCTQFFSSGAVSFGCSWPTSDGSGQGPAISQADFITELLDHRIQGSAQLPMSPTGTIWNTHYVPLLNGTGNTILSGAKLNTMNFSRDGGTTQFWATTFQNGGWFPSFFGYSCDEPPNGCSWAGIFTNASSAWQSGVGLHQLVPSTPGLVTTSFQRMTPSVETSACGTTTCLDNSIDILTTNVIDMSSSQYSNLAQYHAYQVGTSNIGTPPAIRQWWSYSACDSTRSCNGNHNVGTPFYLENPSFQIDTTPAANRIYTWFDAYAGQTGDLYFEDSICWANDCGGGAGTGDPAVNSNYQGGWGDGNTVYPGRQTGTPHSGGNLGITVPIFLPSIRLKHMRDGVQDYEYMTVLRANGKSSTVAAALNSVINTAPGTTGINAWSFNNTLAPATGSSLNLTSDLPDARASLGAAMHALTFGAPWVGIIDPARATDWSQAGIPGGLPDAAWTLCNTLTPGFSGPASTLNAIYTACPNQSYIDVPAGTYTITSGALSINKSQVVYRGHGASQSHFVFTGSSVFSGCSGFNDFIQIFGADCNNQYSGSGWPSSTTWTAGYTQGSNQVTVGSTAGINLVGTTNPTLLFLTQVETGYTGFPPVPGPTQDNIDNGNYFDSAEIYADQYNPATTYYPSSYANLSGTIYKMTGASPITGNSPPSANWTVQAGSYTTTGARGSSPGPVGSPKGNWILRWQYEVNVASSLATGASCPGGVGPCINLLYPLREPNWNTSQTPMIARINAITQAGIENLSIDTTVAPEGYNTIEIQDCYQCIVSGISVNHDSNRIISEQWSANALIQNNYFCCQGTANPDPYGIRFVTTGNNLVQNNIFQKIRTSIVFDGTDTGTVIFANYSVNQKSNSAGNMWGAFWQHSRNNDFQLWEQNIADGFVLDNVHGSHFNTASFRNLLTGWESCAALATNCNGSVKTAQTFPMAIDSINRYQNVVGNVLGTPGKTVGYQTNTQFSGSNVYAIGGGNFNYTQPFDSLVGTTLLRWANWDTFNRSNQFNTGEVPSGISPYPNPVPTAYTGSGGTLPASFFISVKPAWWQVTGQPTIPWPGIGPDITGGNIVECSTSTTTGAGFDTAGQFNGLPTPNPTQCTGSTSWAGAWAGHANANPAMVAYLTLGGNLDGTSAAIPFDAGIYSGVVNPTATLTPTPLAFGNQTVGTTSAGQTATFANTSSVNVTVTSVTLATPFAISGGTCSGTSFTLASGTSCTFIVTFTPSAATSYSQTLSVASNAVGSPNVISLTGTGQAVVTPSASLTPPTLAFGGQNINTTSGTLFATYTNNGSVPVITSNIVVTGNFSRSGGTCVGTSFTLAVSSSCTIGINFSPLATIPYTGALTVTDNSGTSPHVVNLTGTGTQATITWISPQGGSTYNYGNVFLGSSLNSGNLTLQNSGTGPLTVALSVTGTNSPQFVIFSNTCPNPLIAGASCNVVVTFTPATATSYTAFLTETDTNASNSPQNLTLNGSGVIPVPNLVAPWPPIILGGL